MAFDTIVICIVVLKVDLFDHAGFAGGIQRVAQSAKFPAGWLGDPDAVGIGSMVKSRSVAGFAGNTCMGVSGQVGSHIVMAFHAGIPAGIMHGYGGVFLDGIAAVVSVFPERFRDQQVSHQQE